MAEADSYVTVVNRQYVPEPHLPDPGMPVVQKLLLEIHSNSLLVIIMIQLLRLAPEGWLAAPYTLLFKQ
jgi:hypothetical protein